MENAVKRRRRRRGAPARGQPHISEPESAVEVRGRTCRRAEKEGDVPQARVGHEVSFLRFA